MAIYHLSAQIIGRSDGRSSVASASYRCGLKLTDNRTGNVYDYTRKCGIDSFEIIAPDNSPAFCGSVPELWNAVEAKENRTNSQLAREFNIAIPHELNDEAKKDLVRQFVKSQFVSAGVVATVAFHDLNSHNPHAHIMTTTRKVNGQGWSEKARELNSVEKLREWREQWQDLANEALKKTGSQSRIDCRTLKDQGITRTPKNQPSAVWHMKKRGKTPKHYLPPFRPNSGMVRHLSHLLQRLRARSRLALTRRHYGKRTEPQALTIHPLPNYRQNHRRNAKTRLEKEPLPQMRSRHNYGTGGTGRGREAFAFPEYNLQRYRQGDNFASEALHRLRAYRERRATETANSRPQLPQLKPPRFGF